MSGNAGVSKAWIERKNKDIKTFGIVVEVLLKMRYNKKNNQTGETLSEKKMGKTLFDGYCS